jgi:hypothetical protein
MCCGLLTAVAAAGCGSSGGNTDLLTPDQAKQAAQTFFKAGVSMQIKEESGSLQRIDQAHAIVEPLPSPEPTQNPANHSDLTIWIAHQSSYPVTFLCLDKISNGTQQGLSLFRFSKSDESSTWRVSHQDALISVAALPSVALDSKGFAQLIPQSEYGKLAVSPTKVAGDYAAYMVTGNSADAHEFAPGPLTSGQIDQDNKNIATDAKSHVALSFAFSQSNDPVDAYALRDGGALVLVGLTWTTKAVASPAPIVVTKDGNGIVAPAPGKYRAVTGTTLVLAAFSVPPKGSIAKIAGLGAYSGPVSSMATPM